jgi:hypothetical protein
LLQEFNNILSIYLPIYLSSIYNQPVYYLAPISLYLYKYFISIYLSPSRNHHFLYWNPDEDEGGMEMTLSIEICKVSPSTIGIKFSFFSRHEKKGSESAQHCM